MTSNFKYIGVNNFDIEKAERGTYLRFGLIDKISGETIVDFYTNASGCGYFVESEFGGVKQVLGTCQYDIGGSKATIREKIRSKAIEHLLRLYECEGLSENQYRILEELYSKSEKPNEEIENIIKWHSMS